MGLASFVKYFPDFVRITRKGEFIGDAVILKSTFGAFEPSQEVKPYLETIRDVAPDFSEIDFTVFPKTSLGGAYRDFMQHQGLKPFKFSGRYAHLMAENYLPVFYASVHDFYHVLTGYDASWAGEAGVWGFVAGQNISPQALRAHKMGQMIFPWRDFGKRHLVRQAGEEGYRMGREAHQVLTLPFRAELSSSLEELRSRYAITPSRLACRL